MKFHVANVVRVAPATFWDQLFFDQAYNQSLYVALGFANMHVLSLDRQPATITRSLRAEPPLHAPAVIKRRLEGKFFYTERGEFDRVSKRWTFESIPSVLADQVSIRGTIELLPHAHGAEHCVDIEARVTAWGIGSLIERVIERNTRESFATTISFTEQWVQQKGLV